MKDEIIVFDLPKTDGEFIEAYIEIMLSHLNHFPKSLVVEKFRKVMGDLEAMPVKFDWTLRGNYIVWFLTVLAIVLGILVAIQTNNHSSIRDLEHQQKSNTFQLEQLTRQFYDEKKVDREFQSEQRKALLDLANTLNEIRIEQAKKGKK